MSNHYPVIFVHGILGFGPKELGPLNYWGTALRNPSPLHRFEASVGPLSSAHDRACELAAQIKGSKVDYGAAHAKAAGHARYGDDFSGQAFVPDWSEAHPVHLVGHSLGSPTIRCLQHLLAIDYWGWGSTHRWVSSIKFSAYSTDPFRQGDDGQDRWVAQRTMSVNQEAVVIPQAEALALCQKIRYENAGKFWSPAYWQCWGYVKFSKGDSAKMCFSNAPGNRGCIWVNQRFDQKNM